MQTYHVYQVEIDELFKRFGWAYWSHLSICARLLEEVGELAREINHHYGDKRKRKEEDAGDIEAEIGDIIYTLVCFANKGQYSLDDAVWLIPKEVGEYDEQHPLSILIELGKRVGDFVNAVGIQCEHPSLMCGLPDRYVEKMAGEVLLMLDHLARQVGCTSESSIRKSIDKVLDRDTSRFPEGK